MQPEDHHIRNIHTLLEYRNGLPVLDKNCPPEIKKISVYIHEYLFEERLSIAKLTEECRIYGKNFSARFKLWMGQHPQEYYLHHRIEASKLLLQQNKLSITEVGLLVGFSSLSAFCNTFKRKTGIKPSEWRRKNKGGSF